MPISDILTSDPVSAYRTTINDMLDVVNAAATWSSGTLAARPAANAVPPGRFYFTTDTTKLYQSDGTTWTLISDPFFTGTFAARPAANAVPAGSRYRATDSGDISMSDGSAWFTLTPAALCAFAATDATGTWASGTSSSTPNDVSSYDTEVYDVGSHFDPSTGLFTAPVKGFYDFETKIQLSSFGENDKIFMALVSTGSLEAGTFVTGVENGSDSSTYNNSDGVHWTVHGERRTLYLSAAATVKFRYWFLGGGVGVTNARFAGRLLQQLP